MMDFNDQEAITALVDKMAQHTNNLAKSVARLQQLKAVQDGLEAALVKVDGCGISQTDIGNLKSIYARVRRALLEVELEAAGIVTAEKTKALDTVTANAITATPATMG